MITLYVLTFVFYHQTANGIETRTMSRPFPSAERCEAERKRMTEWVKAQPDAPPGFAICAPVPTRANS